METHHHTLRVYPELQDTLHDVFMDIVLHNHLDVQEGLTLLTAWVASEFAFIYGNLSDSGIPHPAGRLWQALAVIAHSQAHAPLTPDGTPDFEADAWLDDAHNEETP